MAIWVRVVTCEDVIEWELSKHFCENCRQNTVNAL